MSEPGEELLDRVEVGAMSGRKSMGAPALRIARRAALPLWPTEIVEDDAVALREGWDEHVLDMEREKLVVYVW